MINIDDKFYFKGSVYSVNEFAKAFLDPGQEDLALDTINLLEERGEVSKFEGSSKEQKAIKNAMKENMIINAANLIDEEKETRKDNSAERKRQGHLTYPKIEIPFNSYSEAVNCNNYCKKTLRIKDTQIIIKDMENILVIFNTTDSELSKISKYYTLNNVTRTMISSVEKTQDVVTKTVDFSVKNIVSPLTSISLKSTANLASTLATAAARTGATAINATAEGLNKTAKEIAADPEIIKSAATLLNAKASIKKMVNKKLGGVNSGIRVTYSDDVQE